MSDANDVVITLDEVLNNQFVVPDQIITDPNPKLSNDARMAFITVTFNIQKRCHGNSPFTKSDLQKAMPWLSRRKYERVLKELEECGYVERTQFKAEGGKFGCVEMKFLVPKIKSQVAPMQPYLESLSYNKTPGQSRSHENVYTEPENGQKIKNPRSAPLTRKRVHGNQEEENPRSTPLTRFGGTDASSPITNKLSPFNNNSSVSEGDSIAYVRDTNVIDNSPSDKRELSPSDGVCSLGGGRQESKRERIAREVEEGRSYVLKNSTEEQVQKAFDIAQKLCSPKHQPQQYMLSRKKIDELLEGDEEYQTAFMLQLKELALDRKNSSKWVSYWFKEDFGDYARAQAKKVIEVYGGINCFA